MKANVTMTTSHGEVHKSTVPCDLFPILQRGATRLDSSRYSDIERSIIPTFGLSGRDKHEHAVVLIEGGAHHLEVEIVPRIPDLDYVDFRFRLFCPFTDDEFFRGEMRWNDFVKGFSITFA